MAKFVLQGLCEATSQPVVRLVEWMDNHQLVDVQRGGLEPALFAAEVQRCMELGDTGPLCEIVRANMGREHESILAQRLLAIGASFLADGAQNAINLTKTPDALLTSEVVVDGVVIKWVESKALFGDPATMGEHFSTQLIPYRDRYGPGLVIYWSGYVAQAATRLSDGRGILVRDRFPDEAFTL